MASPEVLTSQTSGSSRYIGRFAPSPTGPLHFGSLVAAVASYADARAHDGVWLLRIEDVDTTRCSAAAEAEIVRQLGLFGFVHDGEIVRQSARYVHYEYALERLACDDRLFACTCTRKQLESARRNAEGESIYPGTCRELGKPWSNTAIRLRVVGSDIVRVQFTDRACGDISQNVSSDVGDFILKRVDGLYAYQLAVVVDDALQGVTHVVRGEDLLMNTPRQIHLQQCLGIVQPTYLHVPLVRDEDGNKLSKQTNAASIGDHNCVEALRAAWAFLKQTDPGPCESVAAFWRRAINSWSPSALRTR